MKYKIELSTWMFNYANKIKHKMTIKTEIVLSKP